MAGIDKIYGTQKQYRQFRRWLRMHQIPIRCRTGSISDEHGDRDIFENVLPTDCLYPRRGYPKEGRPISNFPESIDMWLLKNCTIEWVVNYIKDQYGIKI
jgi:hypothetical protein